MEWLAAVWESWLITLFWVTLLAIAFALLAWLSPCNRGMFWWTNRKAALTDLCYWFVTPVVVRNSRTAILAIGVSLFFASESVGFAALRDMPIWLQCLAIQFGQDVLIYWMHRLFHTELGWRFHAVHHSPKVLDWFSAPRNHFVNNLFTFILADCSAVLLGFSPTALMILAPINVVWSCMVHANLNWTFGPFRYLLSSPVFHRWHHTLEAEGLNKNFAPTFPILDLLFGTFHMPAGRLPQNFGNGEPDFPEGFLGQLVYPIMKKDAPAQTPEREAV